MFPRDLTPTAKGCLAVRSAVQTQGDFFLAGFGKMPIGTTTAWDCAFWMNGKLSVGKIERSTAPDFLTLASLIESEPHRWMTLTFKPAAS